VATTDPPSLRQGLLIGTVFAGIGLYLMAISAGLLPMPGGRDSLHGPLWVGVMAGFVFFLGGAAAIMQAFGRANAQGKLPAGAPRWMRVAQRLVVIVVFACCASLGTWVALFGEARQFGDSFGGLPLGVIVTRIGFGFGALIAWTATIAVAYASVRTVITPRNLS
jgi:hypothetical protein